MFTPPVADQLLALTVNAGIAELTDAGEDMIAAIVEGAGQFAAGEWEPLAKIGDAEHARIADGKVILPAGYAEAYAAYVAAGWNSMAAPERFGGQGLPFALATAVLESLGTANLAFSLLPMLTVGAIEALTHHGTPDQQARYLPKLVSGEWSGTMNLTEPQAGSDVGALRTTATPAGDGLWRIKGTKVFITWGEHDLAANIVHLVLARTPGAPAGSRGISLFIVPKYRLNPDGTPGPRNDLRAVSLEHKLGIHASPTCVMSYGDSDQCVGELVGQENEGLKAMFTMMNSARINVGAQGVQVAEAAWQLARRYALDRVQSPRAGSPDRTPVAIAEHPDVRRMLFRMRSLTEAGRALLYYTCGQVDRGARGDHAAQRRADCLVPMLKAWGTDMGCEVASLGVQVHGGMGFIEETGAARFYRDARVTPIYEGTNGIQAADLVTRKLAMDDGATLLALMAEITRDCREDAPTLAALADECAAIAGWMLGPTTLEDRLAGSVPFTTMCAVAVAGWQLQRQARAAGTPAKRAVAQWLAGSLVPETLGLAAQVRSGAAVLGSLAAADLCAP